MNAIKALDSHDHEADIHNIKTCIKNLVEKSVPTNSKLYGFQDTMI